MTVPYTFGTATTSIPLSNLDANFNTPITLGNTSIYLGNTTTTIGNLTLTNATISSGTVNITNVTVTTANVTNITVTGTANIATGNITTLTSTSITNSGLTSGRVTYAGASGLLSDSANLLFDGINLDVNGKITALGGNSPTGGFNLRNTSGTITPRLTNDGGNGTILRPGASGAYVAINNFANNANLVTFTDAGNVGLGVTPSAWGSTWRALEGSFAQSWFYSNSATITGLVSNTYNDGTNWVYKTANAASRYELANDHKWFIAPVGTGTATFTQAMTLVASGNLGLGTTNPTSPTGFTTGRTLLQIANASSDSGQLVLGGTSNGLMLDYNNSAGDVTIRNGYGATAAAALINIDSGTLVFRTGTSYTERMRIDSNGNVGIGNSIPGSFDASANRLVVGNGSANQGISIYGSSTANLFFAKGTAGSDPYVGFINYTFSSDHMAFYTAGANERMRITSAGNLLVGVTNTNHTSAGFTVEAGGVPYTTRASGGTLMGFYDTSAAIIGSITNSGGIAVLYNTTSDQRLKTNIVNAPSGNIDNIKVRSFDWIAGGSHQEYGMVAQELLEVAPYAVYQPENSEEMMAVDYSKLVPMMIKEIQDLKQRIVTLENK